MAAVCAFFETVNSGEHVVAPRIMYHGSQDWLRRISEKRGIGLTLFDAADSDDLERALQPGKTAVVWIETPVNPTWDVIDIALAAQIAHAAGAILAVDATVASPVTTRALEHGADIVFHSATKYLNGHSDVVAGVLVTAREDERWEEIKLVRTLTGGILGPFEAWLLLRGMRTLFVRFDQASQTALQLARHFENHPRLQRVLYPGLSSHPGHDIAKRQMTRGFGGMLSLLVDGSDDDARHIAGNTRLFVRATSLGGVESLIEHRASVEGAHSAVPENLLRLSIGIENCQDLIQDLEQSLEQ
jgi:cystathionine gamma-synthase